MALEAGGYAEKIGNRYEASWIAYQLLRLLDEKIHSITVEPLGDDEAGTDVIIEKNDNFLEHHQCKVGAGNAEYWSINLLADKGIIKAAAKHILSRGREFQIVSPIASKQLSDLHESALNSPFDAEQFYKHQIQASTHRTKDFNTLCKHLELETSNPGDLAKARDFLKGFVVTQYTIDRYSEERLNDIASRLFSGEPKKLVSVLKHYADNENKLRTKITSAQLIQDLKKLGFEPQLRLDDGRVAPILEYQNINFEESIRPYLISETVIPRSELNEILESTEVNAVTLLIAEAGMGKSALLLELYKKLKLTGSIVLSIRLDRVKLEQNADALGKSLGFSFTPTHALAKYAGSKKIVLILDQLDAIRWTAAHSDNALLVCKELVRQVIELRKEGTKICLVFASRDFDLNEDIALSSWINSINNDLHKINLSRLPDQIVADLVCPFENFSELAESKKQTLKIPLWLSIYLSIAKSSGSAPNFTNKLELVKRYWDDRITEASKVVGEPQIQNIISELLQLMMKKARLSIAESSLNNISFPALQAMHSVGLLTSQNKQIGFRHQALFDYQVGIKLFKAALDSQHRLFQEIGDFSQQTLTRREHLKYALSMLLAESQPQYCNTVAALLQNKDIRFHLKYLVFNSLKELKPLKSPGKALIDKITSVPALLPYFISITCFGNADVVSYLAEKGLLHQWLTISEEAFKEKLIKVLKSIADESPQIVLKVIQPFIGQSDRWNSLAYETLCWDIEKDSDEMFAIRKQLLCFGCKAHYIDWKRLADKKPIRALDLLEMLLEHYREALGKPSYLSYTTIDKLTSRDTFSESDIEGIEKVSDKVPQQVLSRLLAKIHSIISDMSEEDNQEFWMYRSRFSNYDTAESIIHCVFSLIENAGKNLSEHTELFKEILTPYMNSKSTTINHLLAKLLFNYPISSADHVINWIIQSPRIRLNCGNPYIEPVYKLSGNLIEKFSPHCSSNLFEQLEEIIYRYTPLKSLENYKWRLEARSKGMFYPYWGELQYFLLPTLSKSRISIKSLQLTQVLERKFNKYQENDFCFSSSYRGGMVTSPLPTGNQLSDASWRKLILTPVDRANRKTWRQAGKNIVQESSIEQFARSLDTAVVNQPERFARFVLTLPKNIDSEYVKWIYYGLANNDKSKVQTQYQDGWELCPANLIEQVINHFGTEGFEYQIVRIYENRIAEDGWSENSIKSLVNLSKYAKDPRPEKLNVRVSGEEDNPSLSDINSLANNAINCCRGIAYNAIGQLFWKDERLAYQLKSSVDDAIADFHPAVNYSALNLLLPLFNYNKSLSHEKFLELCAKDIRMSCARGSHYFFNDGFTEESGYRAEYIKLVSAMRQSSFDDVTKEAGREILARWFFYGLFKDEIKSFNSWNVSLRSGACSVITQLLSENEYNHKIFLLLPLYEKLANDDNKNILEKLGRSLNSTNFWNRLDTSKFIRVLAHSKAAYYSVWQIFHCLNENCSRILDYSENLFVLIQNVINSNSEGKSQGQFNLRESDLVVVLQRLYEEANDDEDKDAINICLDIWDFLLVSEVYAAINATQKIDNGMLQ